MKTKRSLSLHGHKTSVALEPEFWDVVDEVAGREGCSMASLVQRIDDQRLADGLEIGLASYIRVWCVRELRSRLVT